MKQLDRKRLVGAWQLADCRWRIVGHTVEHHVTISHNPALVGTVQVRKVQMRGHTLTLSAEEPVPGGLRVHRLRWRPASTVKEKMVRGTRSSRGKRA